MSIGGEFIKKIKKNIKVFISLLDTKRDKINRGISNLDIAAEEDLFFNGGNNQAQKYNMYSEYERSPWGKVPTLQFNVFYYYQKRN